MPRQLTVAAAQLGPIQKADGREAVVQRMVRLLDQAHVRGAQVVVFPELAFTTFFPRWYYENLDEVDPWFEATFPSPATQPLLDAARRHGITVHVGYAELVRQADENGQVHKRRFNTSVILTPTGEVVLKYRKVHLPGHREMVSSYSAQHLEKRYFDVGDLGFPVVRTSIADVEHVNVGMMICNDRRWPEAWRVMGLQQVELVMLGYNTPSINPENRGFEPHHLRVFHSHLSIQAGCYQNSCFAVSSAKAGIEDGHELFGNSIIVNPLGEIMAQASTWDDELVVADCRLDMCDFGRSTIFNFAEHRQVSAYGRITAQTGSSAPKGWRDAQRAQ